jgi:formylglycine-generating enzyme required for sulfatase activity
VADAPAAQDPSGAGGEARDAAVEARDAAVEATACAADCGTLVPVPAGEFTMGCNAAVSTDCDPDELPAHGVSVPAFRILETEVTVAAWSRCESDGWCTHTNPSSSACNEGAAGREDHPINCMEKPAAEAFCAWAGMRLCTEAEWEKAALGTDGRRYPWGNAPATCDLAVLTENGVTGCGTMLTWPVGSKPAGASPCGALDMAGNVAEWVEDPYHLTYDGAPADGSAWTASPQSQLVARGGAFSDVASALRGTNRFPFDPRTDGYYLGVRCCTGP